MITNEKIKAAVEKAKQHPKGTKATPADKAKCACSCCGTVEHELGECCCYGK